MIEVAGICLHNALAQLLYRRTYLRGREEGFCLEDTGGPSQPSQ